MKEKTAVVGKIQKYRRELSDLCYQQAQHIKNLVALLEEEGFELPEKDDIKGTIQYLEHYSIKIESV